MELAGLMPPVTTPFDRGRVSEKRLRENFTKWNKTDLSGYLVLGSNGESVYLTEKERVRIVQVARESIPRNKIMVVGTGMESTRDTISFTNKTARLGADFALVVTPSYFKGSMKPDVLRDHFVEVADSVKIGVILYNVPKFTGLNMGPDLVARLSLHHNIVGIKDSSGDIEQLSRIVHLCASGFSVFVGSAPVLFPALCVGASGGILAVANAVPEVCTRIHTLHKQKKFDEALALQNRMTPLAKAVTATYGIAGLKVAMDLAGYYGGDPRPPLRKPGPEVEGAIRPLLAEATKY